MMFVSVPSFVVAARFTMYECNMELSAKAHFKPIYNSGFGSGFCRVFFVDKPLVIASESGLILGGWLCYALLLLYYALATRI